MTEWDSCLKLANKVQFLLAVQECNGLAFDIEKAKSLQTYIAEEMARLEGIVLPQLPPRSLKKSEEAFYTLPKKPYRMSGEYSELMVRFAAKHGATLNADNTMTFGSETLPVKGGTLLNVKLPMELSNQDQLKEWFLSLGWKPNFYNTKKGPDGKPERDNKGRIILTSPKIQEGNRLCPNLADLQGDIARNVVRWLSLRNRGAVLAGWLANRRLEYDGRLSASVSGLASTHRKKHSVITNLPKADGEVLLGTEFRSLFYAPKGKVLLGYDFTALEATIEAHYCMQYLGGKEYAKELLEGDIHAKTAEFVFAKELLGIERHKDNPTFKNYRQKAKTIKYASTYGASAKKLAKTLGESEQRGIEIHEAFWESAKPLALLRENLEKFWEYEGHQKWIRGIMGAKLWTRSKHALLNTLIQHAGSVCMDTSQAFMDKYLGPLDVTTYRFKGHTVKRVAEMHDEAVWEVDEEIAEDVAQLALRSVEETGKLLKLKVPLKAEYKIGRTWAEIH